MKVSFILPIYNVEKYLSECVESILAQTYRDFEVLLVDDGSPDYCPQICDDWSKKDARIKVIHKPNGGVSSARNAGLKVATGKYVCFVDSDDILPVDALEKLVDSIEEKQVDYALGGFQFMYGNNLIYHSLRLKEGKYAFKDIMCDFIDDGTLSGFLLGSVCGGLYRLDIINKHNLKFVDGLKNNEDGLFNFEYALKATSMCVIDVPVYNYRQDNASSKPNRKSENFGQKIFEILDIRDWPKEEYHYDIQKTRRNVTLAWWNILHFALDYPFFESLSFIYNMLSSPKVRKGLKYMQTKKMTYNKYIIYCLMKYRLCFTFYCLLRFIIPVMQKHISR